MSNELLVSEPTMAPATYSTGYDMVPVQAIMQQAQQVQELMARGMTDGVHYGKIPGCGDKPTLLQPGAQKLMLMFGLADSYDVEREDLPNGHREYTVTCKLISKGTNLLQGSGVGLCSTMEKKYRYRNVSDFEVTGQPIPDDYKSRKQEYRKQGFGTKKINGRWEWVRYKDATAQENPDIADTYNTVLKMASKRALVAAILNSLAVSDMFTQDVEDFRSQQQSNWVPQQQAQQQPLHQDKLSTLRNLMSEAKNLGIKIQDPDDPMAGLMGWIFSTFGRQVENLTPAEINQCEQYVLDRIADKKQLGNSVGERESDLFATEDIVF